MPFDSEKYHRRSIRLRGYDYSQPGAFFITICTHDRACLFGEVVYGEMRLNDAGRIANQCWNEIPDRFPHVELDEFVIMPNHIYGILWITEKPTPNVGARYDVGARHAVPLQNSNPDRDIEQFGKPTQNVGATHASPLPSQPVRPRGPKPHPVGTIVGSFKSAVTRDINRLRDTPGASVWQRNYYEHIIRNQDSLNHIRQYIADNPLRCHLDRENPERVGKDDQWERLLAEAQG